MECFDLLSGGTTGTAAIRAGSTGGTIKDAVDGNQTTLTLGTPDLQHHEHCATPAVPFILCSVAAATSGCCSRSVETNSPMHGFYLAGLLSPTPHSGMFGESRRV